MFAPIKTFRRWHRRVNRNQRRYAVVSSIAATAIPALVMAKGHRIEEVSEFPLVVSDKVQAIEKTKAAVTLLKKLKAWRDIERVYKSKHIRAGKGKLRNRRRVQRLGPVIVYADDKGLTKGFRNIPGVETLNVNKLNLLRLAPGGHVGRFVIWTESAFKKLDEIYGTWKEASQTKKNFNLPQAKMSNADLSRLIQSDEIQNVVRPTKTVAYAAVRRNPLKNGAVMKALNPHAAILKKYRRIDVQRRTSAKSLIRASRAGQKVDAKALKQAASLVGVKIRPHKEWRKEIAGKKSKLATIRSKVAAARKARAAKA